MKQKYWYKIWWGKWDKEDFDPEYTFVFIEAWNAGQAIRKAEKQTDEEEGEMITSVEYLGYKQI